MGIVYICECKYQTIYRKDMKNHLNRVNSCIPGKNMSIINVDNLESGRMYKNLTNFTEFEKKERFKEQVRICDFNSNKLGKKTIEQFSGCLLKQIKSNTKLRNKKCLKNNKILHNTIKWNVQDIVEILENTHQMYIVPDTILGTLIFPIKLTNGYYNTASFDRIDDSLGYFHENIEIRPHFLNTPYKLTTENIKNIIILREQFQNNLELINIAKYINNVKYSKRGIKNFFYELANNIKTRTNNTKNINKTFDFESIEACSLFLIDLYIYQGGRCKYTNIPIYPEKKHIYKISPERLDPTKSYNKDNIVLIVVGLNSSPVGQWQNENLTEDEKNLNLKFNIFNQEYWDICTKITPEISKKCNEVKNYGTKILMDNIK